MKVGTVIIAYRRIGQGYWEGYTERSESDAKEWAGYYHSISQIA
jgi:hypothetical protein